MDNRQEPEKFFELATGNTISGEEHIKYTGGNDDCRGKTQEKPGKGKNREEESAPRPEKEGRSRGAAPT